MYAELALDHSLLKMYSQKSSEALPAQGHGCLLNGIPSGKYQQGLPGGKAAQIHVLL
jgi:hypothetical protein